MTQLTPWRLKDIDVGAGEARTVILRHPNRDLTADDVRLGRR
jgi:hypothetical protein